MIHLRTLALAASVFALPLTAMAASSDSTPAPAQPAASAPATTTAPAKHHKKPVHHVSHKTSTHKKAPTNSQS